MLTESDYRYQNCWYNSKSLSRLSGRQRRYTEGWSQFGEYHNMQALQETYV